MNQDNTAINTLPPEIMVWKLVYQVPAELLREESGNAHVLRRIEIQISSISYVAFQKSLPALFAEFVQNSQKYPEARTLSILHQILFRRIAVRTKIAGQKTHH